MSKPDRFNLTPLDYSHCTVDADRCPKFRTFRRWFSCWWRAGGDAKSAGDRDLGTIELHPQPLTEWGDREDHTEATIVLDAHGRDRLIAALIEGRDSIEVYGESGGGYLLNLQIPGA